MKWKRIGMSALVTGLFIWGLAELFHWILADLIGAGSVSRIAPLLAGAVLGMILSMMRQAFQKKREEMLGTNQST